MQQCCCLQQRREWRAALLTMMKSSLARTGPTSSMMKLSSLAWMVANEFDDDGVVVTCFVEDDVLFALW